MLRRIDRLVFKSFFSGVILNLSERNGDQTWGRLDLTGQDARVLWYSLKSEEKPASLGLGNTRVNEKKAGDMVCWKTWVGDYVSFNCRIGIDWNSGKNIAQVSEAPAAE